MSTQKVIVIATVVAVVVSAITHLLGRTTGTPASLQPGIVQPSVGQPANPMQVRVPTLVALPLSDVTQAVTALGLQVGKVIRQRSDRITKDHVVASIPPACGLTSRGATIDLVLSDGPAAPVTAATETVAQAAATPATKRAPPAQATPAPAAASPGATEATTAVTDVAVPPVTGMNYQTAEEVLVKAGLTAQRTYAFDEDRREWVVLRQDPSSETRLPVGAPVRLVVNRE